MDFARALIASQSHRKYVEPRFLAKRVVPFVIVRPDFPAASVHPGPGMSANTAEAGVRQDIAR